jgi:hypothetical protein
MSEKQRKGFAIMDPAKAKAAQRTGGINAQRSGRGHRWSTEAARAAGELGRATRRLQMLGR